MALEIALGLRPWEISWASGSVFSNTSLLSAVYGYNMFQESGVKMGSGHWSVGVNSGALIDLSPAPPTKFECLTNVSSANMHDNISWSEKLVHYVK